MVLVLPAKEGQQWRKRRIGTSCLPNIWTVQSKLQARFCNFEPKTRSNKKPNIMSWLNCLLSINALLCAAASSAMELHCGLNTMHACIWNLGILFLVALQATAWDDHQPLANIAITRTRILLDYSAVISASPELLGSGGKQVDTVKVTFTRQSGATEGDWIGLFSPAVFNSSSCAVNKASLDPKLCTAPIKYQYANFSTSNYVSTGKGTLVFRIINQRSDFAFGLFTGGLQNPVLLATSNTIKFAHPKFPAYPRISQGKAWNEMSVTWTSGYGIEEAIPLVLWGPDRKEYSFTSPASTLSFTQDDMCGGAAKTVGWRDPGYIHTSYLTNLWPRTIYYYTIAHKLQNGSLVTGEKRHFKSAPSIGENSLQRVIIFGDMGKGERDGSNEYNDYQPGSLNTTDRLIEDIENIDIVLHIGDIVYSNGYLSQWDQFTEQVETIASRVPYMIASGNHERDWPGSGSFYNNSDSGGECGVPAQIMFDIPAKNKAKSWYSLDYGMFHFCIADSEQDWRPGTEQYMFIEECLATVDRQKQPWLIFIAHRVLGYSASYWYGKEGSFAEPMGRESLQKLWQKYKVDLALYGHAHAYERSCPVYENTCVSEESKHYSGTFNATIHLVVGGGGASLVEFSSLIPNWSVFRDFDYGFSKLTAFNHSTLLFEYKKSSNGKVYDQFWIERQYKDVLGCDALHNCPEMTLAS